MQVLGLSGKDIDIDNVIDNMKRGFITYEDIDIAIEALEFIKKLDRVDGSMKIKLMGIIDSTNKVLEKS